MGAVYERLDAKLTDFIGRQKMFFVATAPLSADGQVNVSPKGHDTLVVLDPLTVAWLDLGGSGIETVAHLRENGRITLMFCAFEGRANILRLYGRGEAVTFDDPGFAALRARFAHRGKARAVIVMRITRIADSCGWGVPLYEFQNERDQLTRYIDHLETDEWAAKHRRGNAVSIDGLPGLT